MKTQNFTIAVERFGTRIRSVQTKGDGKEHQQEQAANPVLDLSA